MGRVILLFKNTGTFIYVNQTIVIGYIGSDDCSLDRSKWQSLDF